MITLDLNAVKQNSKSRKAGVSTVEIALDNIEKAQLVPEIGLTFGLLQCNPFNRQKPAITIRRTRSIDEVERASRVWPAFCIRVSSS